MTRPLPQRRCSTAVRAVFPDHQAPPLPLALLARTPTTRWTPPQLALWLLLPTGTDFRSRNFHWFKKPQLRRAPPFYRAWRAATRTLTRGRGSAHSSPPTSHPSNASLETPLVGQITAIFERNRANDDTSIKFGTFVLQGILIKSA